MLLHSLISMTSNHTLTTTGNQVMEFLEIDISIGNKTLTKKPDLPTCQWTKTMGHHTSTSRKHSMNWNTTNISNPKRWTSRPLELFTLKVRLLYEELKTYLN
jgi:hypothetical protein